MDQIPLFYCPIIPENEEEKQKIQNYLIDLNCINDMDEEIFIVAVPEEKKILNVYFGKKETPEIIRNAILEAHEIHTKNNAKDFGYVMFGIE